MCVSVSRAQHGLLGSLCCGLVQVGVGLLSCSCKAKPPGLLVGWLSYWLAAQSWHAIVGLYRRVGRCTFLPVTGDTLDLYMLHTDLRSCTALDLLIKELWCSYSGWRFTRSVA